MRLIQLTSLIHRRQQRAARNSRRRRRRLVRAGLGCAAGLAAALFGLVVFGGLAYLRLINELPDTGRLQTLLDPQDGLYAQPTRIYDRTGQHVLLTLENPGIPRRFVPLDPRLPGAVSPEMIRAVTGQLDPYFWGRPGFSLRFLFDPQPRTIAERLASNLLLWEDPPGIRRTLRMRFLAAQIVDRFGHVQVLEWFLNSASYGHRAYGVDSAARLYLNKPASQLTLAEAALLVAALQSPALNPLDAPQPALERQSAVLERLYDQGVIQADEFLRAAAQVVAVAAPPQPEPAPAAAFTQQVLDEVSARFGAERVEQGGLRVITTLDYDLQLELDCLARAQLSRLAGGQGDVQRAGGGACRSASLLPALPPEGALPPEHQIVPADARASGVVLDPRTGEVLALLGDRSPASESARLASHPPGTLLTPVVALAGFQRGLSPASLVWDIPASLPAELAGQANPDGVFHGPARLRTALANDYLAPLAQLLAQTGVPNVTRTASLLGFASLTGREGLEVLYGAGQVSPLEAAQAYGVLAAQGARSGRRAAPGGAVQPVLVSRVEDLRGVSWLDARQPETQTVVTDQLAYLVHHMLSDQTARWPSLGSPNALEIGRPSGAKIGRVSGSPEAWAVGYIPQRVAVFWLGVTGTTEPGTTAPGTTASFDPRAAAGLWHALMQYMGRDLPVEDWPEPAGIAHVEVCDPSGLLPTSACPQVVSEVFQSGSEPSAADRLYQRFQINYETGRLATVFTPPQFIEEQTFLVVPPLAAGWARTAGLPVPPNDYDPIQPPPPSTEVRIDSPGLFAYVRGEVVLEGSAAGEGFRYYQVLVGQGLNPQSWVQVGPDGTDPVENGRLGVWDTRGLEGLYAVRLLVVRTDWRVESAVIQVTVDNTPPTVRIPDAETGPVFPRADGGFTVLRCEPADEVGISRVVWIVDGLAVGETAQAPYLLPWQGRPGRHTLQVRVYDMAGNVTESASVQFTVEDTN